MAQASLVNLDTAGGGLIIGGGQNTVNADGKIVSVKGDSVFSHPPCPDKPAHCAATMITASSSVNIGGKGIVRSGDLASCLHSSTGSSTVNVGL